MRYLKYVVLTAVLGLSVAACGGGACGKLYDECKMQLSVAGFALNRDQCNELEKNAQDKTLINCIIKTPCDQIRGTCF